VPGQTGEGDPLRFQANEEQDVVGGETSPRKHLNREEVGTCQDGEVAGDEILPGRLWLRFGAGWMMGCARPEYVLPAYFKGRNLAERASTWVPLR
jgi:hypothetical protein